MKPVLLAASVAFAFILILSAALELIEPESEKIRAQADLNRVEIDRLRAVTDSQIRQIDANQRILIENKLLDRVTADHGWLLFSVLMLGLTCFFLFLRLLMVQKQYGVAQGIILQIARQHPQIVPEIQINNFKKNLILY